MQSVEVARADDYRSEQNERDESEEEGRSLNRVRVVVVHRRVWYHSLAKLARSLTACKISVQTVCRLARLGNVLPRLEVPEAAVKWSIDCADAYAVARTRHAVIDELAKLTGRRSELFPVETVLGELLGAEMERGHLALAVLVEQSIGGPTVHVYTQGRSGSGTHGEIREAILRNTRLPMSVEVSAQGTHICLRVQTAAEAPRGSSGQVP